MGVTKGRPGKVNNCKVLLNENDAMSIVLPINDKPEFRRRNVTTYGIDLMHSEGAGGKVWARFKSQKANEMPFLIAALESMRSTPPAPEVDLERDKDDEIELEPGRSMFYCESCTLKVEEKTDGSRVRCAVLQSKNHSCPIGSIIHFTNVETVRNSLINACNS